MILAGRLRAARATAETSVAVDSAEESPALANGRPEKPVYFTNREQMDRSGVSMGD
jgi:hypothetical protein